MLDKIAIIWVMNGDARPQFDAYLDKIRERAKKSRIHSRHQMIGLMVADTLGDRAHKALYIKMARDENGEKMLYMAKSVAENAKIKNKGAYFMRVWRLENKPLAALQQNTQRKSSVKNKKSKVQNKKQNGHHNGKKSK